MIAQPVVRAKKAERYLSLDVFRGVVMVFLLTETTLELPRMAAFYPDSAFWNWVSDQTSHEIWIGCRAWDLIQPSFMLMVGVAVPFSIASRLAKGATPSDLWRHTARRTVILILLGIFLRSMGATQTYFTFEDVITQIGLGYPILFWLAFRSERAQWMALAIILIGYWALFAFWPTTDAYLLQPAGEIEGHPYRPLTGFFAHWNIHANPAAFFDRWFLNLFPRENPFVINSGGYQTLSFIPSLGTMLLGLLAGGRLRQDKPVLAKIRTLIVWGIAGLSLAVLLHMAGICPIVKRIWTPTWTLLSGGIVFLLLAFFVWAVEVRGWRRGTVWLVAVGANSMAAYLTHWTIHGWMRDNLRTNLGLLIAGLDDGTQHLIIGSLAFALAWYVLYWLYQRKIFVRI